MSLDESLNSSFGQKGESQVISASSSIGKTYERLVRKQNFSLLPSLNI